jgi:Fe-S-cluster-containing dehydrogenase component
VVPTSALFRSDNGVVDFDDDNCIGCKACMNACPYDAIYLNPQTTTAHKCNFCNHRLEDGLEPSCVVVCPTQAIRVGDLDDPSSEISRLHAAGGMVRSPEQNTRPKVVYTHATSASLDPLASAIAGDGSSRSPTLMAWVGHTTTHDGSRPSSSRWLQKLHLWAVVVCGLR